MGSHYERDRTNGTITVSQTRFIESMLSKFESLVETHGSTSMSEEDEDATGKPFREVVGPLMWIANQSRPDISNAVRAVA